MKILPAKIGYSVAIEDNNGFDFGGDEIARFTALGDAYAYAKQIHDRTGAAVRVWNNYKRKQEYLLESAAV